MVEYIPTHAARNQGHEKGYSLGTEGQYARWRAILARAKHNKMNNVMLRTCIDLALRAPDMAGEDVVAYVVTRNACGGLTAAFEAGAEITNDAYR